MIKHSVSIIFGLLSTIVCSYVIPEPNIEWISPKGIRVSIPDEVGVQFFAFHANVNDSISVNDSGAISGQALRSRNGRWTWESRNLVLNPEDVLHYWIYVQANGVPYTRSGQKSRKGTNEIRNGDPENCETSVTTVRGKQVSCRNRLIFEETFDREINFELDTTTLQNGVAGSQTSWSREILMPMDPDYEFCVYGNLPNNLRIDKGVLKIVLESLDDIYGNASSLIGTYDLRPSCTGTLPAECRRRATSFNILPPIMSSRLNTKQSFHFRYGKIEIRAKFPKGDWIYPELWLQPKHQSYGIGYSSGRVILGMARGNDHLVQNTDAQAEHLSSRILEFGLRTGPTNNVRQAKVSKQRQFGTWVEDFHVYTTFWSEDGFRFQVDGEDVGRLDPPSNGWLSSSQSSGNDGFRSSMQPYDVEFYVSIGLGVGGIRVFPDGTVTGRYTKPWRNVEAKAMLRFWQKKDEWLSSWMDRDNKMNAKLEVDYVKVWSI